MVGVSAIGIYDETDELGEIIGLRTFPEYTNMERLMLDAIISECQSCISSEGADCMPRSDTTNCHFIEVRKTCGIMEIKGWE